MADSKISALSAVTTIGDTDEYVAAVGGATKKITGANIKAQILAAAASVKIGGATLGSPAANIDITSIPATYSHLRLHLLGGTSDANATNVGVRFNADGTSIYDYEIITASAASPTCSEGLAQAQILAAVIPGTGAASMGGGFVVEFPFYAGTTFHKTLNSNGGYTTGTGTGNVVARIFNGRWRSTVAINQITLTPVAGNFIAGSAWTLYGIR